VSLFAWVYDLLDLPFEYGRYRKIRPLLFWGLSGRILEAGVGTGQNFPFYPPGVVGGPPGKRNGQYRHGERTKAAIAERQKFSALLKMLRT
jgi:hypothetical protein